MRTKNKKFGQLLFFLTITFGIMLLLFAVPRLSIPFGWTIVLYLIFLPIHRFFLRMKLGPTIASMAVVILVVVMTLIPILKMAPLLSVDGNDIKQKMPLMEEGFKKIIKIIDTKVTIPGYKNIGKNSAEMVINWTKNEAESLIVEIPAMIGMVLEWAFIIPLTLFFLFRDGDRLKYYYFKLIPNPLFERFYNLIYKFNRHLGDYIFAKFFEAIIVGVLITTGLIIMEVPYPILLGTVAGLTNVIPYLGPILGAIPGVLVMFLETGAFDQKVGIVSLIYLLVNLFDMGIIFPVLVSRIVNLHPFIVVISVILGGQILGIVGMILSVPLTTAFKLLIKEFYNEIYPGVATLSRFSD